MRIKKFKNLWTMGLILTGSILIVLYLIKLIFPDFIVGVAQLPSIVTFGTYIDTHKWAWYLVSCILSFITYYLICGACCSKKVLNRKEILSIIAQYL